MTKNLSAHVVPVGNADPAGNQPNGEHRLNLAYCYAPVIRQVVDWKKSELVIKWNASEKLFYVEFSGKRDQIGIETSNLLSKRIPLQIAHSSVCECGENLELGDYEICLKNSDFKFNAQYYCQNCRETFIAKNNTLKKILERWFSQLKRIEITITGVRVERNRMLESRSPAQKS